MGMGQQIIDDYKKLSFKVDPELVSAQDFQKRYDGFFDITDFEGVNEVFVNEKSGWPEAAKALKALIDATLELGVRYIEREVSTLTFDDAGDCTGVKFFDGQVLTADNIILSTGALTAKLIADSAPDRPELQVGERIVAGAVVTGIVSLNAQEGKKYTEIPVTVHGILSTQGEILPLTAPLEENEAYTVKFCRDESFKNTCHHVPSNQNISMPPSEPGEAQRSPTAGLKARLDTVKRGILGPKAEDLVIDEYRVCWDGGTPNQDFVITPHPHCKRLFIATAGSFHGWKFMPTLGRYVVEMLDGTLDPALAKRWAWDRGNEGGAHKGLLPQLELRDL